MGRIVISENLSLDGVVQDPTGEEGFARGGWFTRVSDNDQKAWGKASFEEACDAEALLLGRRTYEFFTARWPARTGAFAERLNSLPKYVISSTLQTPDWANTTVLHGNVTTEVSDLKRRLHGDIVVYASFQLVRLLLEHDLVDELRVTVYPFVLGDGQRLFGTTGEMKSLRLRHTTKVGDNLALLTYQHDRKGA